MVSDRRARRPRPTRSEERAAIAERRSRSLEEPLDVRERRGPPYPLLEVRNPLHGTVYLVMLPAYPERTAELCTCTDFARRGLGTCKHIEAAYRWRTERPESEPAGAAPRGAGGSAAVWKEIDRRLANPGVGPSSLRLRRSGAVLFERSPGRA